MNIKSDIVELTHDPFTKLKYECDYTAFRLILMYLLPVKMMIVS